MTVVVVVVVVVGAVVPAVVMLRALLEVGAVVTTVTAAGATTMGVDVVVRSGRGTMIGEWISSGGGEDDVDEPEEITIGSLLLILLG